MNGIADVFDWLTDPANWQGENGITNRTIEHVVISGVSLAIACALALPLALWLGHTGRGGFLAINVTNVGRAIPTFALLSVFSLTWLGFGNRSVVLALVLFAIPPILTNTYVGMREVDRDTVEAARGMGMSGFQVLRRVELPLATPLLMNGVRLAGVQIIATATIAALVAGPGLGRIISQGVGTRNQAEVVSGALLVVLLSLLVERLLGAAQNRLDPVHRARTRQIETASSSRRVVGDRSDVVD
jgi:osmoprotectant transport system permease protein